MRKKLWDLLDKNYKIYWAKQKDIWGKILNILGKNKYYGIYWANLWDILAKNMGHIWQNLCDILQNILGKNFGIY